MNSNVRVFDFKDNPVRIIDQDGGPWFVATDVCRVLAISNPRDAVGRLHSDEKGVASADTLGGKQALNIVSESGLYALIFASRKPSAQEFRRWVTHEVLPAIRKTGRFEMDGSHEMELPAPDPEIPRDNVINFLQRGPELVRSWPLTKKIYFALCVRRFSKGFGIGWVTTFDPAFGRVQVVPAALLYYVAQEIAAADSQFLAYASGSDDIDLEELVRLMAADLAPGEKQQYTFRHLFEIARSAELFGLTPATELDSRLRTMLGKRITAGSNKRYGDVLFKCGGSYRRRFYLVRRLNISGVEAVADSLSA